MKGQAVVLPLTSVEHHSADRNGAVGNHSGVMGLVSACAWLAVVIAAVSLPIALAACRGPSAQAVVLAAIAGGICWVAAALSLGATFYGNLCQVPVHGVLLGMMFRMGLPLFAVLALPKLGGEFAAPGATTTILGVYLVALFVETFLALRMVPARPFPGAEQAKAI